jgi:hypothetical protein
VDEVVLGKPRHPEAGLVRQLHHLQRLLIHLLGGGRFIEPVARHEEAEIHHILVVF